MSEEVKYAVFEYPLPKLPKLVKRKLGKEKAWGQFDGNNTIEIDERLKGKKELIITLHEMSHAIFPKMSENDIIKYSEIMAAFLWKNHYRKVDNEDK